MPGPRWWSAAAAAPALLHPDPHAALETVRRALQPYGSQPALPGDAGPLPGASEALYRRSLELLELYASTPRGGEREGGIAAFMAAAEALEEASPGSSARLSLAMARLAGRGRGAASLHLWSHVAARAAAAGGRPGPPGGRAPEPLKALVDLAVEAALAWGPWSLVSPPPAPSVNPAAARLLAMATGAAPAERPPAPWEAFHILLPPRRGGRPPMAEPYWRPPPLPRSGSGRVTRLPVCSGCHAAPGLLDGLCPACMEALRLGGLGVVAAGLQRPPRPPLLPRGCSLALCPWDPPGRAGRAAAVLEGLGLEVAAASGSGALAAAGGLGEAFQAAAALAGEGLTGLAGEPWLLEASTAPGAPAALLSLGPRCASPPCSSREACSRFCSGIVLVARGGLLGAAPVRAPVEAAGDAVKAVALLAEALDPDALAALGDAAASGGVGVLAASREGRAALEALKAAGVGLGEAGRLGVAAWLRGRPCPRGWRRLGGCPGYCYTGYAAALLYAAAALAGGNA